MRKSGRSNATSGNGPTRRRTTPQPPIAPPDAPGPTGPFADGGLTGRYIVLLREDGVERAAGEPLGRLVEEARRRLVAEHDLRPAAQQEHGVLQAIERTDQGFGGLRGSGAPDGLLGLDLGAEPPYALGQGAHVLAAAQLDAPGGLTASQEPYPVHHAARGLEQHAAAAQAGGFGLHVPRRDP